MGVVTEGMGSVSYCLARSKIDESEPCGVVVVGCIQLVVFCCRVAVMCVRNQKSEISNDCADAFQRNR